MAAPKQKVTEKIDGLMERASEALSQTDYFTCEQLSQQALEKALRISDWSRMRRILMPLEEARRQKRLAALDAGKVTLLEELPEGDLAIAPGCWLVEPPLTGADGREIRHLADERQIPILLLTREPKTQLGKWPIVVVGPVTIRTYVSPPKGRPDAAWFVATSEALGDAAIQAVNPEAPAATRVNALFEALGSVRDHDKLHQALAAACDDALREERKTAPPQRKAS